MLNSFTDQNAPRFNGTESQLPRGLVRPPQEVAEHVAKEQARLQPYYTDEYARQSLEDQTLTYYYEGLPVAYRSVPEGVEVLAVGWQEVARYWQSPQEGVKVKQP